MGEGLEGDVEAEAMSVSVVSDEDIMAVIRGAYGHGKGPNALFFSIKAYIAGQDSPPDVWLKDLGDMHNEAGGDKKLKECFEGLAELYGCSFEEPLVVLEKRPSVFRRYIGKVASSIFGYAPRNRSPGEVPVKVR